jgi:drug/metabolite transporter (DMT)-like permease
MRFQRLPRPWRKGQVRPEPTDFVGPEPDPAVAELPAIAPPRAHVGAVPLGLVYVAAGAFFFSVMSLLVKVAGTRLPNSEIVLVRAVVMLVLSYGMLRAAGPWPRIQNHRLLIARGAIGFVGLYAFYYTLVHLPLAEATVIQYTNPVFSALIAVWLLQERLVARELLGIMASLLGVVLIARPSFLFGQGAAMDPWVVAIGLAGAVFSATAYVLVRKLRTTERPAVIVFYFAWVSALLAIPLAWRDLIWPTPVEWAVLLGVGVATHAGQVCLTKGLHLERAGRATTVSYLQIVFAIAWGVLVFHALPAPLTWLGAVMVVASALAVLRPGERKEGGQ